MKILFPISSLFTALLVVAIAFTACQKEDQLIPQAPIEQLGGNVGSRAPGDPIYGVTTFKAGIPCLLVTMDPAAETVLGNTTVTVNGNVINDLKGVCRVGNRVYVTTGPNPVDALSNMLLDVNPQTGVATVVSYSTVGTVSDIDYNPLTGVITGLRNNSNRLVNINGAGFANYAQVNFALPLSSGYTARGLTWVRSSLIDPNLVSLKVAAAIGNTTVGGPIKYFEVPVTGGNATFEAVINPNNQLAGGNCGLGYVSWLGNIGRVFINKNGFTDANTGLNRFEHAIPLNNPTNSASSNISGFNFEDLSTDL